MKMTQKHFLKALVLILFATVAIVALSKYIFMKGQKEYAIINSTSDANFALPSVMEDTNNSWDQIEIGNEYFKSQDYASALDAFRKAYRTTYGSKSLSGLKLAKTYEKLGRHDEGINLLDEMVAKGYLSEQGVRNANEIKARLLTAKTQSAQN